MKLICNTRENRTIADVTPGALLRVHTSTMTILAAVMIPASSIANAEIITGYAWRSLISRRMLPFGGLPDLVRVGIMIGMVTGMTSMALYSRTQIMMKYGIQVKATRSFSMM